MSLYSAYNILFILRRTLHALFKRFSFDSSFQFVIIAPFPPSSLLDLQQSLSVTIWIIQIPLELQHLPHKEEPRNIPLTIS